MDNEKKYILTNLVSAKPMTKGEYRLYVKNNNYQNVNVPSIFKGLMNSEQSIHVEGYMVEMYGNVMWFPKKVFELMAIQVVDNKKLPSGVNIDEAMVDDFISCHDTMTVGNKTTVVRATLRNGFEIIESSGCVDDANYDLGVGEQVCLKKIKTKVWEYLGFLLQSAWRGF